MEEEFEILSNPSHSVHKLCEQLLGDPDFSDVTLVCRDCQQIPAHQKPEVEAACSCASCSMTVFIRVLSFTLAVLSTETFIYLGSCTLSKKRKVFLISLAGALEVEGWPKEVCDVPLADEKEELLPVKTEDIEAEIQCISSKCIQPEASAGTIEIQTLGEFQGCLQNLSLRE